MAMACRPWKLGKPEGSSRDAEGLARPPALSGSSSFGSSVLCACSHISFYFLEEIDGPSVPLGMKLFVQSKAVNPTSEQKAEGFQIHYGCYLVLPCISR